VLGEIVRELKVPCIAGIPVGHIAEQWTIPLGAMATLDADACALNVTPFSS
jgi:muramoyltetrapeptide carboxypeptidase